MAKLLIVVIIWFGLGAIGSGFLLAEMRGEHCNSYYDPSWAATRQGSILVMAVGGPITLIITYVSSGFGYHGWTLTRLPTKNC